jgi:hypothetical protein
MAFDFTIDTSSIESATANNAATANNFIGIKGSQCNTKEEGQWVTFGSTAKDGFTIKELNPPKLPEFIINNRPVKGAPTLPTYGRGINCGTGVGNANLDLVFNCNFVANLNIDSCLFKLQKTMEMYVNKAIRYAWYIVTRFFPILDFIRNIIETLCNLINNLLKVICFIKQLIKCVLDTIRAVIQIVEWVISLPAKFVVFLIECVTNFIKGIAESLRKLTSIMDITGLLSICKPYNCEDTSTSFN